MAKQTKRFDPKTEKRGLHNWKHLFVKPTTTDIIILLLLLMTFVNAWAYNRDMKACRDFYEENACKICGKGLENSTTTPLPTMFVGNIFKEDQSVNGSVT